jgi:hypothetical protein
MGRRYIVPQDPESFAVRDIDQVLSIVQQNAADCVERLKRPWIRRVIQVQQSHELGPPPPVPPPSVHSPFAGIRLLRALSVPAPPGASAMARPTPTICNVSPDALFGNFTRLTTFGRYGLGTSTIVKPYSEACWMYRYCLPPCPWRKILAHGSSGRRQVDNHSHRVIRRLELMFCGSAGCHRDEE